MALSGGRWVCAISCVFSAALAAMGVKMWGDRASATQADFLRSIQMHARCIDYWAVRSPLADATFEFEHGRRELLQTVKAVDPSLDFWVPGLREGSVATVRKDFPLKGPKLDDLQQKAASLVGPFRCDETTYAWDYNVTMLRLSGREQESELRSAGPEFSSQR
ncbi:hypothetical protein WG908_16470 [Sphingobium sp. AN641]|uniref:hypothetical protein n=1 Tax=Sphingobium sp. AN641 TaxID=3133443 RepID=UPI0030BB8799